MTPSPSDSTTDSLVFTCKNCGQLLKVPHDKSGVQVSCPKCQQITIAAKSNPPTAPPPGPIASAPISAGQQANTPQPQNNAEIWADVEVMTTPGQAAEPTTVDPTVAISTRLQLSNLDALSSAETPTKQLFNRVTAEISKLFVGQDELVIGTLVALFSSGHVLIESVPGLGKTLFIRTLGQVLGIPFGRIQFTADLMPSDITGAPMFDMKTQEFKFRPGPVFTQLLLADEINRSPAKTHAALLEIMQEYRVTIDGTSHVLDRPFLVLATQNPVESEGTYNLPEAQLDRFMFKLMATYPNKDDEANILKLHSQQIDINERLQNEVQTVTSVAEILQITRDNAQIRIEEKLINYINEIVRKTREWPGFHLGASPRAGLALMQGARTLAAFYGRDYAVPDDVAQISLPALRHRVILSAEAEVEGVGVDELLIDLIRSVEVPRL